ncbi:hypothetical protein CAPTEDRAFT_187288 [Capitella teleta]|uniref:VWFD domain-containing protein n=1 Tax=Capitella teleta TaxID=283909 RepID=X1ZK42_CAPTE|nr:hypothetical protein CAPTEDRAFT_187288 [Capitella teleta]|eukprot:ELU10123.1 hypothetical protein CAPTEDRAFT_187288 [Capitella teleta]
MAALLFALLLVAPGIVHAWKVMEISECVVTGDPHIYQYDSDKDVQSQSFRVSTSCTYVLTSSGCTLDTYEDPHFCVVGAFDRDDPNEPATSVHKVEGFIHINGILLGIRVSRGLHDIRIWNDSHPNNTWESVGNAAQVMQKPFIIRGNLIFARGGDKLPARWGFKSGSTVVSVVLKNGINFMYDGQRRVKIEVPPEVKENLCGLCGNRDKDRLNDDRIGPLFATSKDCQGLCENSPYDLDYNFGDKARIMQDFVNSWYYEGAIKGSRCAAEWGKVVLAFWQIYRRIKMTSTPSPALKYSS